MKKKLVATVLCLCLLVAGALIVRSLRSGSGATPDLSAPSQAEPDLAASSSQGETGYPGPAQWEVTPEWEAAPQWEPIEAARAAFADDGDIVALTAVENGKGVVRITVELSQELDITELQVPCERLYDYLSQTHPLDSLTVYIKVLSGLTRFYGESLAGDNELRWVEYLVDGPPGIHYDEDNPESFVTFRRKE